MEKINHRIIYKEIYKPRKGKINIIEVPKLTFLQVKGHGHPEESFFQNAAQTIYTVSYTLKFLIRDEINTAYRVMPMEVIWDLDRKNKKFNWVMMIMQPNFVSQKRYEKAFDIIKTKEKDIPLQSNLKFIEYKAGICVQTLHVGQYEKMNSTLKLMKQYALEKGYETENDTHDIYMNDKRKTKLENLRTIMLVKAKKMEGNH